MKSWRQSSLLIAFSLSTLVSATAAAKTAEITILKCTEKPQQFDYVYEIKNDVIVKGVLESFEVSITVDLDNKDPSGVLSIQGKGVLVKGNKSEAIRLSYPKGALESGYNSLLVGVSITADYDKNATIIGANGTNIPAEDTWIKSMGHDYQEGGSDFAIFLKRESTTPILLAAACKWNWAYKGDKYFVARYVVDQTKD